MCFGISPWGNSGGRKPRIPADRSRAEGRARPRRRTAVRCPIPATMRECARPPAKDTRRAVAPHKGGRGRKSAPWCAARRSRAQDPMRSRREIRRDSAPQRREPITVQQRRTQASAAPCRRCACPADPRRAPSGSIPISSMIRNTAFRPNRPSASASAA